MTGDPSSVRQFAAVAVPTLVIHGEKSEPFFHRAAQALAKVLPNAQIHVLKGQAHNVSWEALAPVLADYFGGEPGPRPLAGAAGEHAGQPLALHADGD